MYARPGELPAIDRGIQAEVVDSITAAIDTIHVIKETADQIIVHLHDQLAAGAYRDLTDPMEFVRRLDQDARTIYDDHHFGLVAMHPIDPQAAEQVEDPRETEAYKRRERARNYGFRKVEILAGNIGYLKLDQFRHTTEAADVANAAMSFFANTDALIIDLRENGGGSAGMIRLLASYLFEGREHLINWFQRATDLTVQSWTLDYVPGKRLPEIPIFVLTSGLTGSAAEEFTFDLKHLERATIVGETTGGGGHTIAQVFIEFDGFRIGMRLPYGRAYDPKTGEGWEGAGVAPHIAVPAPEAPSQRTSPRSIPSRRGQKTKGSAASLRGRDKRSRAISIQSNWCPTRWPTTPARSVRAASSSKTISSSISGRSVQKCRSC